MRTIPREARRITYSTEIRNLKKVPFTQEQREVALGSVLGDGHLEANWSKTNYLLKISHSVQQSEYVRWKYEIFRNFVLTEPKVHRTTNSLRFATISHSEFTGFRNIFYRDKKKIIPENLVAMLTPLAIAVWFMDDGNAVKSKGSIKGYHINSQSFTFLENVELARILERTYGIHVNLERNHEYYRLAIWQRPSREKFIDLVWPFMLDSMKYKIFG